MLVLRREDPARNMARFYCLSLESSLFGETVLVARWGRIGTYGRRRETCFKDTGTGTQALDRAAEARARRGYRAVGFIGA